MSWTSQQQVQQVENEIPSPAETEEALYEPVGEEVQRLSVVQSLPDLLQEDNVLCMQRVVPKVQQALPQASAEFHMAASQTFFTILEKKLVHPRTFTQTFLHSIVSSLESKDPVVANAWLETLLDVMDLLPTDVIRQEILPIAVSKGQLNQSVSSRLTASKLLGKVCMRFETYTLKKEALPLVQSLCQDVNAEVRASMCSQLKYVAKGFGPEGCKVALLPSLVELANDEESKVRLAALNTIVDILSHFQADTMKTTIIPLVKKICSHALAVEDMVLGGTSLQLGKLCLGLDNYLTISEKKWFMSHFQQLAQLGVSNVKKDFIKEHSTVLHEIAADAKSDLFILCRQHCAYNFPAMAMFSTKQGDVFNEQLYTTFCDLTCDPYFLVRRTIACGIHEVTSVLGPACGMVKNELVKLLRDDSDEVLQGLIPNIAMTMELLAKTGNLGPDSVGSRVLNDSAALEIGRALVKCEAEVGRTHNWRLHALLLQQLECLPNCLPSDFINSHFVPIMFTRIHTARPVPCRVAAARTLLVFLRYNQKQVQRSDIRSRIFTELCRGRSCYSRMMFVKICHIVIELYSRRYFKDYFFTHLLELAEDKIPNIRLALVALIPKLKAMLRLPTDRQLLLAVESCVRRLLLDEKDRDVVALLNVVIHKLDKIEVKMEMQATSGMAAEDLQDQQKLEEENKLCTSKYDPARKKVDVKRPLPVPASTVGTAVRAPAIPPSSIGFPRRTSIGLTSTNSREAAHRMSAVSRGLAASSIYREQRGPLPPPYLARDSLTSLEDEFYVDAGIRIPQELAASDLPPFPSRIPNLREILFRNRTASDSTIGHVNPHTQKISVTVSVDVKKESPDSLSSAPITPESKLKYSPIPKKPTNNGATERTANNTGRLSSQTSSVPKLSIQNSVLRRHSGMYSAGSSNLRGKGSLSEQKQKDATVIANRRHSYMDGEKVTKGTGLSGKCNEIPVLRKGSYTGGNRRHSYIERTSSNDAEKNNQSSSTRKSLGSVSSNKRLSYVDREQSSIPSNMRNNTETILRKGSSTTRNFNDSESKTLDAASKRRSLIFTRPHNVTKDIRRVSSLDRGCETEVKDSDNGKNNLKVSETPLHPHSLALENKRRHSSLERDDLERLKNTGHGKSCSNKTHAQSKVLCSSMDQLISSKERASQKSEEELSSGGMNIINNEHRSGDNSCVFKNDLSLKTDKDSPEFSVTDENLEMSLLRKGNRLSLSKIPRGVASCHSSPGSSRASSPTGVPFHGNATRVRQRTAPNSRASSPTSISGRKGPQRLSLGSLNSYMSNLKLADTASRLPIRKPPP